MKSIQRHEGQASSAIEAKKQRSNLRLYARARKQRDNVDTGLWHLVMKCQYQVLLFVALHWMQCSCAETHQQANRVAKISISSDEPPGEKLNCSACLTWKMQHNQMEQ